VYPIGLLLVDELVEVSTEGGGRELLMAELAFSVFGGIGPRVSVFCSIVVVVVGGCRSESFRVGHGGCAGHSGERSSCAIGV
jgi:hypothetical protein